MKWPWHKARRDIDQAQERLDDLARRRAATGAELRQIREENGFMRMVRESMGPAR
jgi:hypothetical protein